MAVTVTNTPATKTQAPRPRSATALALASVLGAAYVVIAAVAVFWGVPRLWASFIYPALANLEFVSYAVLGLLMVVAAGVLIFVGRQLAGSHPPVGLRAGIVTMIVGLLVSCGIALGVGNFLENRGILTRTPSVGLAVTGAVVVVLMVLLIRWLTKPKGEGFLVGFEGQGWFHWHFYKRSQGLKVRRLTILGLLVLGGTGIWSLYNSSLLQAGPTNWTVRVPFADVLVTLLPAMKYSLPFLILAPLAIWFAFRVVNLPVFADFLIATEAELNKVSWTPRRQLWRDTVVVLITVVLFTIFLFVVDQIWAWSFRAIGVLPKPDQQHKAAQVEKDRY